MPNTNKKALNIGHQRATSIKTLRKEVPQSIPKDFGSQSAVLCPISPSNTSFLINQTRGKRQALINQTEKRLTKRAKKLSKNPITYYFLHCQ